MKQTASVVKPVTLNSKTINLEVGAIVVSNSGILPIFYKVLSLSDKRIGLIHLNSVDLQDTTVHKSYRRVAPGDIRTNFKGDVIAEEIKMNYSVLDWGGIQVSGQHGSAIRLLTMYDPTEKYLWGQD